MCGHIVWPIEEQTAAAQLATVRSALDAGRSDGGELSLRAPGVRLSGMQEG